MTDQERIAELEKHVAKLYQLITDTSSDLGQIVDVMVANGDATYERPRYQVVH